MKEFTSDDEFAFKIEGVKQSLKWNWSMRHRVFLAVATFFTIVAVSSLLPHSARRN